MVEDILDCELGLGAYSTMSGKGSSTRSRAAAVRAAAGPSLAPSRHAGAPFMPLGSYKPPIYDDFNLLVTDTRQRASATARDGIPTISRLTAVIGPTATPAFDARHRHLPALSWGPARHKNEEDPPRAISGHITHTSGSVDSARPALMPADLLPSSPREPGSAYLIHRPAITISGSALPGHDTGEKRGMSFLSLFPRELIIQILFFLPYKALAALSRSSRLLDRLINGPREHATGSMNARRFPYDYLVLKQNLIFSANFFEFPNTCYENVAGSASAADRAEGEQQYYQWCISSYQLRHFKHILHELILDDGALAVSLWAHQYYAEIQEQLPLDRRVDNDGHNADLTTRGIIPGNRGSRPSPPALAGPSRVNRTGSARYRRPGPPSSHHRHPQGTPRRFFSGIPAVLPDRKPESPSVAITPAMARRSFFADLSAHQQRLDAEEAAALRRYECCRRRLSALQATLHRQSLLPPSADRHTSNNDENHGLHSQDSHRTEDAGTTGEYYYNRDINDYTITTFTPTPTPTNTSNSNNNNNNSNNNSNNSNYSHITRYNSPAARGNRALGSFAAGIPLYRELVSGSL